MRINKKRALKFVFAAILITGLFFGGFKLNSWLEWRMAVDAAGSMPYQIGLTNVNLIQCTPSCCAPTCTCCIGTPGTLCATKDVATCSMYQEAQGMQAGGMGTNALFSTTQIAQAGLTSGGQLIAGGMSPVLMDSGVLASAGGCSGCVAKNSFWENTKAKIKFIIAGFDH